MCDTPARGLGWRGWMDIPEPVAAAPDGPWIDCSHRVSETMPRVPLFQPARIRKLMCLPQDPINVTEFTMVVHTGTHIDAPCHFYSDGPLLHEIPLQRLHGPGVVWQLDVPADLVITPAVLAAARPRLRPGDILAIYTGTYEKAGTDAYDNHPVFSPEAADWIVAQRVKLLAVDFATPDLPVHRRGAGFNWPVHHRLLRDGVLICEHLRGHAPLANRRAEFMFNALNIEGSDGSPVRAMARLVKDRGETA